MSKKTDTLFGWKGDACIFGTAINKCRMWEEKMTQKTPA